MLAFSSKHHIEHHIESPYNKSLVLYLYFRTQQDGTQNSGGSVDTVGPLLNTWSVDGL